MHEYYYINYSHKRVIEYICSYRIERSVEQHSSNNSTQKTDYMAHQYIIPAVDIHRRALELVSSRCIIHTFCKNWNIYIDF